MNKQKRNEDIHNRYTLALAERNFTEKGTENYKILSEVARLILKEYATTSQNSHNRGGKPNRYGFRLYGGKYHLVILQDSEIV